MWVVPCGIRAYSLAPPTPRGSHEANLYAPTDIATRPTTRGAGPGRGRCGSGLQVLAGVGGRVDGPAGLGALAADERADVDDPLALLARDLRPVVGVGRVGQVLVLLE